MPRRDVSYRREAALEVGSHGKLVPPESSDLELGARTVNESAWGTHRHESRDPLWLSKFWLSHVLPACCSSSRLASWLWLWSGVCAAVTAPSVIGSAASSERPSRTALAPRVSGARWRSPLLARPGWWAVQNRRHRMWRAVCSAEHSVAVARRCDVAVGDLPALATQVRAAAGRADAVLCVSARAGSLREEDRANCERIEAAAADIHSVALSSLRSVSREEADPVVSAVQIEVAALAAGVKSAYR